MEDETVTEDFNNDDIVSLMKRVLADTFVMYYQAHAYHWNVEGKDFYQHHRFFGDLYSELYGSIDTIAEQIRALDSYAPISLNRIKDLSYVVEDTGIPLQSSDKFIRLLTSNNTVINCLKRAHQKAEDIENFGLASFIEVRLDAHAKHGWMLRSHLKG